MIKIGKVKITGKVVNRRLNHHLVRVLEPTRKLTLEEANKEVRKILRR